MEVGRKGVVRQRKGERQTGYKCRDRVRWRKKKSNLGLRERRYV